MHQYRSDAGPRPRLQPQPARRPVTASDSPPGRLADDYYLIAHDDRTGRARSADPVVGIGLAAAMLGELMLSGHLAVADDVLGITHLALHYAPSDALANEILRLLTGRPQDRDLGTWIAFLAAEAASDVAGRLVADGQLTRRTRRSLGGFGPARVECLPVDLSAAAWPTIRLGGLLASGGEVLLSDVVLTGLVEATGLLKHVLWDSPVHRPGYRHSELLLARLPAPFLSLLARTRTAVGAVVMTKRA